MSGWRDGGTEPTWRSFFSNQSELTSAGFASACTHTTTHTSTTSMRVSRMNVCSSCHSRRSSKYRKHATAGPALKVLLSLSVVRVVTDVASVPPSRRHEVRWFEHRSGRRQWTEIYGASVEKWAVQRTRQEKPSQVWLCLLPGAV